jgi:MFS family permease
MRLQLTVGLASLFAPLNSSMLAVALPAIRRDFDLSVGTVTWLISAYLVAVAVCQPAGGRLGDAFGYGRVMRVGMAVLIAASIAATVVPGFPALVLFRALQGVAAALIAPNALACLRQHVAPDRLGGALGANGAAISAGAAVGPLLGGALLLAGEWHLLFLVNVPLALLSMALLTRLPADAPRGRAALNVDAVSLVALLAWFMGITLVGTAFRTGSTVVGGVALGLFVAGAAAYLWRYHAMGRGVVDLQLFRIRNFGGAAAGTALSNVVLYTALIAIPLYLEQLEGLGDAAIGLVLFSFTAAFVVVAPVSGHLVDRIGGRSVMGAGACVLVAGSAALTLAIGSWPLAAVIGALAIIGVGMGLLQTPQQAFALTAVRPERAGSASGTFSMMRYVGSVTAAALLAGIAGSEGSRGEFQALFAVTAAAAILNIGAWLAVSERAERRRPEPAAAEPEGAPGA